MDVRLAVPEREISAEVLEPALETVTRLNERLISEGSVPTFQEALSQGRVKWKPEPPGAERFDHAQKVYGRGWGDCDDLAPWHAASLRVTGVDPKAEAGIYKSGPGRWHAIVHRSNGTIEDPSLEAGMRRHSGIIGAPPAVVSPMFSPSSVVGDDEYETRPTIALRPNRRVGAWEGRTDIPWTQTDYAISALSRAPTARTAIQGAILGACILGETAGFADAEHIDRLRCVLGLLDGEDPHELAYVFGEDVLLGALPTVHAISSTVGFNFGKLFKSVAPFISKAVSFIPGVGPAASTALDVATHFIKDKKINLSPAQSAQLHATAPSAAAAAATHAAAAPGVQVHPGATFTEDREPVFRPIPKGAGYIHIPGGPVVLRF